MKKRVLTAIMLAMAGSSYAADLTELQNMKVSDIKENKFFMIPAPQAPVTSAYRHNRASGRSWGPFEPKDINTVIEDSQKEIKLILTKARKNLIASGNAGAETSFHPRKYLSLYDEILGTFQDDGTRIPIYFDENYPGCGSSEMVTTRRRPRRIIVCPQALSEPFYDFTAALLHEMVHYVDPVRTVKTENEGIAVEGQQTAFVFAGLYPVAHDYYFQYPKIGDTMGQILPSIWEALGFPNQPVDLRPGAVISFVGTHLLAAGTDIFGIAPEDPSFNPAIKCAGSTGMSGGSTGPVSVKVAKVVWKDETLDIDVSLPGGEPALIECVYHYGLPITAEHFRGLGLHLLP